MALSGKLFVHDGDRVKESDILVHLDDTATRSNLAIYSKGLDELNARKARLKAERDGRDTISFPSDMLARASDPDVADILASEKRLFELRKNARLGEKAQLNQRIEQLKDEIGGLNSQLASKEQEIVLIDRELVGIQDLYSKRSGSDYSIDRIAASKEQIGR